MKNYNKIFKFEPSKNNSLSYIVYRKNFSGHFNEVATAKIFPGKCFEINYSKTLKKDEQKYIENNFGELASLIIKPESGTQYYTIYRKTSSGKLERVAIVALGAGYEISCILSLSPSESVYLGNYFRALLKTRTNK